MEWETVMRIKKNRDDLQSRLSDINPDAIINKFAMIAVAGSDAYDGADNIMIPPLKIINWAYEKIRYATLGKIAPPTCFIGRPIKSISFIEPIPNRDLYTGLTGIRFYSYDRDLQPHYCIDKEFRSYLDLTGELIPIRIYGTKSILEFNKKFIEKEGNFFLIGDGDFRLYIPGMGFNGKWPEEYRYLAILEKMEDDFISTYSKSI